MQANPIRTPTAPSRGQVFIILGASILLIVLGIALLVFGVSFVQQANESRNWPMVTGQITNVRVTWDRTGSTSTTRVRDREYYYMIYYDYTVDGQAYSSTRYSLGGGSNAAGRTYRNEDEAREAAADAYTPASDIVVFYDPNYPSSAVLQPGAGFDTYIPLIFSAFLLLFGAGFFSLFLRLNRLRKRFFP